MNLEGDRFYPKSYTKRYTNLDPNIRQEIRQHALKEQFHLCAYCCQRIDDIDTCHDSKLVDGQKG